MAISSRLLTVKELSDYLRVHPSTIYRLLKRGDLPGIRLGSDWRFSVEAIELWRQRQRDLEKHSQQTD
jgi:excisionase family DNA binding protein